MVLMRVLLLGVVTQTLAHVVVETSFGKLLGTHHLLFGCDEWLGVPYAKPPLGDLRFADPVLWDDHFPTAGRAATSYGAFCFQPTGGDEDCLYLNVWRPSGALRGAAMAAMVWIHGGGFDFGSSSSEAPGVVPGAFNEYCGCTLSRQGVVVASMNYRLGPLGFAAFEDGRGRSGNFGIKDQRLAMRWLRRELGAFGGDPAKVTIFGESAGGISVFHHVVSPLSKGLFRAAISESGFPSAERWEYSKALTREFAAAVNCTDLASLRECLRSTDVKTLIQHAGEISNIFTNALAWFPAIDGVDLPDYPHKLFKSGQTNAVPLLAGTTTDECNAFVWPFYEYGMNRTQYYDYVAAALNGHDPATRLTEAEMAEVFAKYPESQAGHKGDFRPLAASMMTDGSFLCGTQQVGQYYGATTDFFLYRFNHRSFCEYAVSKLIPGVFHTAELPYVWADQWSVDCFTSPQENALGNRIQKMWTNFAKYLNPSFQYTFPKYTNTSRFGVVLQVPEDTIETDYRNDYCELWQKLLFSKQPGVSAYTSSHEIVV